MFDERFRGISASPLGRWKEALSMSEARMIEAMLATSMTRFAYTRVTTPSFNERLHALWWKTRYWLSSRKAALFFFDKP